MKNIVFYSLFMLLSTMSAAKDYPVLTANTLANNTVTSQGKVTYLKFWATWCSYCVEEMPLLEQSFQQANNHYQVIAVNIGFNQSKKGVQAFLDKHDYQFPTVFDGSGKITQQFQVLGTPQHILIDENGKEIYRSALFTDELQQHLSTLQGAN
ncbi:TlpA disulfide reductase family protein [Pseudoalteromonas sp. OF7H-1]|uniref:TlpA family protein disulfide reductase n=1 Tax=Pseudoalteromonas sp. OF7H-1 TaxID=2917755 RepID=UPI001EF62AB2|nr:TlpA disulfide reductase family protein [Pseudoalteromonas sp. OF7H-1]MCG7540856.1 TlpA family protein disulfide reductase [Pseudoalteromonas sp. OF7H-1]